MKTAILISGQMRSFRQCFASQRWHVYRHFEDPEFWVTVQDNPQAESIDLLRAEYGPERVHVRLLDDPVLPVSDAVRKGWGEAPYANAAPPEKLLLQHWYQSEVWGDYLNANNEAELVVRVRADLKFHSFDGGHELNGVSTPWWGKFGGCNDRFAVMDHDCSFAYFSVYDMIEELLEKGCPFHPESLTLGALEESGVSHRETLRAEFSTLRMTGEQRWPEITMIDMAHAAMR